MRFVGKIKPQPIPEALSDGDLRDVLFTRTKVTWLECRDGEAVNVSNIFDNAGDASKFIDRLNKPVLIEKVV